MKKYLLLSILITFNTSFAFATSHMPTDIKSSTNITADIALNKILNTAIKHIVDFQALNENISIIEIKQLIKTALMPFLDSKLSTQISLKKHWDKLNNQQKNTLEQYIITSLIKDYGNILVRFKEFNKIKININPKIRTRGNKAIVEINFMTNEKNKPLMVAAKMIKNKDGIWRIYDIVFSGISLMKNYSSQFNSYIKRKGFDKFTKKYLTSKGLK